MVYKIFKVGIDEDQKSQYKLDAKYRIKGIVTPIYDEDDPTSYEKSDHPIKGFFSREQTKNIFQDEEQWFFI